MSKVKEEWRDIKEFEGLYQVSNLGRIKSFYGWNGHEHIKREKILKPTIQHNQHSYKRYIVNLTKNKKKKTYKVHRLVAEVFIQNLLNRSEVNHIDGNPLNNNVSNLEWCTCQENIIHSYKYLRKKKYSDEEIIEMVKQKISPSIIYKKLNISSSIYYSVLKRNDIKPLGIAQWQNKYNINLEDLLNDFKNGKNNKELSEKYKCSKDIIATRKYQFRKKELI